jgi:hypothetical protein
MHKKTKHVRTRYRRPPRNFDLDSIEDDEREDPVNGPGNDERGK